MQYWLIHNGINKRDLSVKSPHLQKQKKLNYLLSIGYTHRKKHKFK